MDYKEDQFKDIGFLPIYSALFKPGVWLNSWANEDFILEPTSVNNELRLRPVSPEIYFPKHSITGSIETIKKELKEYYEKI